MHPRSTPTRLPRWGPRAGCVAPSSNTPGIATPPRKPRAAGAPVLGRRALPTGHVAGLGATPGHHPRKDGAVTGGFRYAARLIVGQGLAAAVEDDPLGRRLRDDGRQDGERAVVERCRPERQLRAIEVDVVARPQFGEPRLSRAEPQG